MMKTKRFCKSTVSLLLVFMMLVSMLTVGIVSTSAAEADTAETGTTITGGTTLYLKPSHSDWTVSGGRYAAYLFGGTSESKWYSATSVTTGVYKITVDSGESHNNIIWCRMNGSTTTNSWDNKWNQTVDLTWDGTNNCFTVTSGPDNDNKYSGSWSTYTDPTATATFKKDTVLYLKPNTNWKGSSAWFAAYFVATDGTEHWVKATDNDGDGYYEVKVPVNSKKLIWVRMDPAKTTLSWDSMWNKTGDIESITSGSNCYSITSSSGDPYTGSWSAYTPVVEDPQYYLVGNTITNGDYEATTYPLTEGSYSYTFTLDASTSAEPHKFKIYEATTDTIYGLSSSTSVTDKTTSEAVFSSTGQYTLSLVATGGSYTVTFNPDTLGLSISYTSTGGGDDDDDTTGFNGNIYLAIRDNFAWYGIEAYYYDENHTLTGTEMLTEDGVNWYNEKIATITSKVSEWGDNARQTFYVYDIDVPATTAYIKFKVYLNNSEDEYFCEPVWYDEENDTNVSIDYHDLSQYDYKTELIALYEHDQQLTHTQECDGNKSKIFTHDEFTDDEVTGYTVTANFEYEQDNKGNNSTDDTILIKPTGSEVIRLKDNQSVDWTYSVYVNDELVPDAEDLASTATYEYKMENPDTDYKVTIKVTAKEDTTKSDTASPQIARFTNPTDPVLSADFTGEHDGKNDPDVVITPIAKLDGVEITDKSTYTYDVYVNGEPVQTNIPGENPYTHTIPDGNTDKIYIKVHHTTYGEADSVTREYTYSSAVNKITFNVGLKSSSSYRYIPSVSVNGGEALPMTAEEKEICYNENYTQAYYWYWATVEVEEGKDAKITFTNIYNKTGATCVLASSDIKADERYKFGYDNLNYGKTAIWYNSDYTEAVVNFVETATHMVATDEEAKALAQTQVNGVTYYMGDADVDGNLSIMDATTVQLALAKRIELSDVAEQIADYSTDNVLSIYDVTIIQKKLAN